MTDAAAAQATTEAVMRPRRSLRRAAGPLAPAALLSAAGAPGAVLRLWDFGRVGANPFYDAAVRSMTLWWHDFFLGAFEPGAQVSVDKARGR